MERLPRVTGHDVAYWLDVLRGSPASRRFAERVDWLRDAYGLPHAYAAAVVHEADVVRRAARVGGEAIETAYHVEPSASTVGSAVNPPPDTVSVAPHARGSGREEQDRLRELLRDAGILGTQEVGSPRPSKAEIERARREARGGTPLSQIVHEARD
jgi:hypothetical protein